jgi:hypothetical protein
MPRNHDEQWAYEREQAAALGDGPLAMFDNKLPLKFMRALNSIKQPEKTGVITVEFSSKVEDDWQAKATDAAVAGARKIVLGNGPLMNTPVGRLSDHEWSMIIAAIIFGWIEVRVRQAIGEGLDQEQAVRLTGFAPDPCDVAVVTSILAKLTDTAAIDWSKPLSTWSKSTMTDFLLLAWQLLRDAEHTRDHGRGKILRKAEFNPETGDALPF